MFPSHDQYLIVPCGQCMACRINHKRMWTGRILLESMHAPNTSTFLTLTYNDDSVPRNHSLKPMHLTKFIDRCRKGSLGHFRYFAVGEYGDKTQRPHYHLAIFNAPPERWAEYFHDKWNNEEKEVGFTQVGEVTKESASYIAGYCTKKLTSPDDERLEGRYPEFNRMSCHPPLGS